MITNAGISAVLATGHALVYDLVTLTINRGRCWQFDANGQNPVRKDILDSVRWTSAPRALRANVADPVTKALGYQVFQPLQGVAYQRSGLSSKAGAEVLQVSFSVAGTVPVSLSTAQDGSGAFATTLAELALLGMLEGAVLTIDQVVCTDLPATPVSAGPAYGIVSPDPVRRFAGVLRGAKPTGDSITFEACDPLILGGGSVPRNQFSPMCRWEFASGVGCRMTPGLWMLAGNPVSFAWTHLESLGSNITFPSADNVQGSQLEAWSFIVPQDGPMMGMRFQVGAKRGAYDFDFADRLPWTWSCTKAHVELGCNKAFGVTGTADQSNGSGMTCAYHDWHVSIFGGAVGDIQAGFGGSPDMPRPESA